MSVSSEKIDQIFAPHCPPDGPGCAVGILQDGELVYSRGFGLSNLEHAVAVTPRTVFRVASLSKQFTGACIALLIEEGRLTLADEIHTYLPELPDYGTPVTIGDLLYHTSGLQDFVHLLWGLAGYPMGDTFREGEVLALLSRLKQLDFEPGTRFLYSNTGYFLLSVIIRRVTGLSLAQYAEQHIFQPLGMRDTHFHDDPTRVVKGRATGYVSANAGGPSATGETGYRIADMPSSGLVGDDGLFTTLEDMARWDRNFYQNRLGRGSQGLIDLMLTPGRLRSGEPVPYGFGHFLGRRRGLTRFWHYGEFLGFQSAIRCFPEQRFTVIVLGNSMNLPAIELAVQVEDLWLADRFPEPAQVLPGEEEEADGEAGRPALSAGELAAYAGEYECEELSTAYRLTVEDGRLCMVNLDPHRARREEMEPQGHDRFQARFALWQRTVTFQRAGGLGGTSGGGKVTGFRVDNYDSAPTWFGRRHD